MSDNASLYLQERLNSIQHRFSGQLSFAAHNLATGESIQFDDSRIYPTASVFKMPVMVEVYRQYEAGLLDLSQRVTLQSGDIVKGSGILRDIRAGAELTLADLVMLMIIVSDNTATNMLIDLVGGIERINATIDALGMSDTRINSRIDFDFIGDDGRRLAVSSPRDLARLMQLLARGEVVSQQSSDAMLGILGRQHYLNQFPRYVQYNSYGPELGEPQDVWIGCKTGALPGLRADAGLITLPGDLSIAFAVMNEGSADTGFGFENESEVVNGLIGWSLIQYWWPKDIAGDPPLIGSPYFDQFGLSHHES
ncbi:MAG: serine hydrolase [Thermomicrobiales bacterium]|nr:serine hydrolase [Thermomicrobiales bacterium]